MGQPRSLSVHIPVKDLSMNRTLSMKWALTLLIPFLVYFIPVPLDVVNPKMPLFLAFTVWAVVAWITEILPSVVVATVLTFLYALFVTTPQNAFGAWLTFLPWISLGALIFAHAMECTGLGKRIALRGMLMMGGSFRATMFGLIVSGLVMALIVPGAGMARLVIYVTIGQGLVSALAVDPRSRLSSALMFGCFMAATTPCLAYLTAGETPLQMLSVVSAACGRQMTWMEYFRLMTPFGILYCLGCTFLIFMVRGKERLPDEQHLRETLTRRLEELGPFKASEAKTLFVMLIGLVGFVTESWHHMNGAYIFCCASMTCFLPGINLANQQTLREINTPFLFFLCGCMSIGFVANAMNVPQWITGAIMPMMQNQSVDVAIMLSYLLCVVLNFLLTPMACLASMGGALTAMATELGLDPYALALTFQYGCDQHIFPYQTGYFLYLFTSGAVCLRYLMPALAVRIVAVAVAIPLLLVPYWKFIGYIQ